MPTTFKSTAALVFRPQQKVKADLLVDGVKHVRIGLHHHLLVGQTVDQCPSRRIILQVQFGHGIAHHLRRPIAVVQQNAFVQQYAIQFDIVRLVGDANDEELGFLVLLGGRLVQLAIDDGLRADRLVLARSAGARPRFVRQRRHTAGGGNLRVARRQHGVPAQRVVARAGYIIT